METLQGKKIYSLVETDYDFGSNEELITVESYASLEDAKSELTTNFNQVLSALEDEKKEVNLADNQKGFADIETDGNRWHWEIQSQIFQ